MEKYLFFVFGGRNSRWNGDFPVSGAKIFFLFVSGIFVESFGKLFFAVAGNGCEIL
ncbi:MAG: hypothetical protein IKU40_07890 [Clostridia bacterium]|nr:hypothetical protein [Clostridia bacterium]